MQRDMDILDVELSFSLPFSLTLSVSVCFSLEQR